jgi:hypothetical protein
MKRRSWLLVCPLTVAATVVLLSGRPAERPALAADRPASDNPAVLRARTEVKMLDDVYKGFVIHATRTYVTAQETIPAAVVAKKVFQHMEKQGWGKTRLVDATGKPARKANMPITDFEKRAVAQIKAGKAYYEELGDSQGRAVLRAATVVPAVLKQCTACHTHVKEGQVLGALVYEVPIR